MKEQIDKKILEGKRLINLEGNIKRTIKIEGGVQIGKNIESIINISKDNLIIDGNNSVIEIKVINIESKDVALFNISKNVKNVEIRNLNIDIEIINKNNTTRKFILINNEGERTKIINNNIKIKTTKQINIIGISNNGDIDTPNDIKTDKMIIEKNNIEIECNPEKIERENKIYAIYNKFSNSILISNNYIYVSNKGKKDKQLSVGIYTNGWYGRISNNNVISSSNHPEGNSLEEGESKGVINEGTYTIITSNNIVGQWGGKTIGLENVGDFAIIENNKILTTHTMDATTIKVEGRKNNICNNIIISTGINVKLVEVLGDDNIISQNINEVLKDFDECNSGIAIYVKSKNNIITQNMIRNIKDYGICVDKENIIQNNKIICKCKKEIEEI